MTEQMKRNDVKEQLTENQRAVQAKLKKGIKKVGGIPREVAETTIGTRIMQLMPLVMPTSIL